MNKSFFHLWNQKRNLFLLVKNDFAQNHLASYFGFAWALIGPTVSLVVIALVFQYGLRASPNATGINFVAWLTCGMVPWFYFADGLQSGSNSVVSYGFLVRKAAFRISYLPAIRLCSAAIIHCTLMLLLLCIVASYGHRPSLYWLQWFYYFPLLYLFLLGISWATSALSIFVPDINSMLGVLVSLGFWFTPVVWNPSMLPPDYRWLCTLNPAYYITQGYRETFLEELWFWQRPLAEHMVFFIWLAGALALGAFTFKKLRPNFADVI